MKENLFENFDHLKNADLKNFSTMKTGGKAKMIVFPKDENQVVQITKICQENNIKMFVLGNGSNVLFDDRGFSGVVMCMRKFDRLREISKKRCDKARLWKDFQSDRLRKNSKAKTITKNSKENTKNSKKLFKKFTQNLKICDLKNPEIKKYSLHFSYDINYDKKSKSKIKSCQILSNGKIDEFFFLNQKFSILKNHKKYSKKTIKNNAKNAFENCFCGKFFFLRQRFVEVDAGVNLFALNLKLADLQISGLEWCFGIPASVGGFVVSNGGCFGFEIGQFAEEVLVCIHGRKKWLKRKDLVFSYRHSNLKDFVVLKVKFALFDGKKAEILQKMHQFYAKKRELQPCDMPSLGSVFKRIQSTETVFPAKLIDNLGLKGVTIGKAKVSEKHAGFVVNTGGATSKDVLRLIEFLEKKLLSVGVCVEREIVVLSDC